MSQLLRSFQNALAVLFLLSIITASHADENKAHSIVANENPVSSKGNLVIIGGALRQDNAPVWKKIIALAGEKNSRIAVIPSASGNPDQSGQFAVDSIQLHGGNAFLLPLSEKYDTKPSTVNKDPQWISQIDQATGVYFTGGDQSRITNALKNTDGSNSPLLNAIWKLYQRGGVIAGTSAGAAIMSTTMFHDAKSVLDTLKIGVTDGKEIAQGLGFIGNNIFVDQHLIIRGRFARMIPVMLKKSYKLGLGIDENTAMIVLPNNILEIVGYKGAVFINLYQATTDATIPELNVSNINISYLNHGDQLNLSNLTIIPSADKTLIPTPAINPESKAPFYPNILANTTVIELMSTLMESKNASTKGLAFNSEDIIKPDLGFEFTFSKSPQSKAYFSSQSGAEAFTISNIRLDIQPVKMALPLYQAYSK